MAILYSSSTGSSTRSGSSAANAGIMNDGSYCDQPMKHINPGIEEARRLADRAKSQVDTQEEKIRWMRLSGLSTDAAEGAWRTMCKIHDQTMVRLKRMTEAPEGD